MHIQKALPVVVAFGVILVETGTIVVVEASEVDPAFHRIYLIQVSIGTSRYQAYTIYKMSAGNIIQYEN